MAVPAGVALLARLGAEHRPDVAWFASPPDSFPEEVARVFAAVHAMSFGGFVALAVEAAERLAGPWAWAVMRQAGQVLARSGVQLEDGPPRHRRHHRRGLRRHQPDDTLSEDRRSSRDG